MTVWQPMSLRERLSTWLREHEAPVCARLLCPGGIVRVSYPEFVGKMPVRVDVPVLPPAPGQDFAVTTEDNGDGSFTLRDSDGKPLEWSGIPMPQAPHD